MLAQYLCPPTLLSSPPPALSDSIRKRAKMDRRDSYIWSLGIQKVSLVHALSSPVFLRSADLACTASSVALQDICSACVDKDAPAGLICKTV